MGFVQFDPPLKNQRGPAASQSGQDIQHHRPYSSTGQPAPSPLSINPLEGLAPPTRDGEVTFRSYRIGKGLYRSLEHHRITSVGGDAVGLADRVNAGMIPQDARYLGGVRQQLKELGPRKIIDLLRHAADLFLEDELLVGEEVMSPKRYCQLQSMVTGSPVSHCLRNMHKIADVMRSLNILLANHLAHWRHDIGLHSLLRNGECQVKALGAQLPSNSPGVHQLWIPFLPFVPVVLKPGSGDPFSPARIRSACIAAGLPEHAISLYYSSGADVGQTIREACGHFMMFGSADAIRPYRLDPRADIHGPGYSKVVFGPDLAPNWEQFLPILIEGIMHNGGRSCINTSVIIAPPPHAEAIAHRLARDLLHYTPKPLGDRSASLAFYPNPLTAEMVYRQMLERCTEGGGKMIQADRSSPISTNATASALAPTVAYFPTMHRAAMKWEFLAPSVAVVAWQGDDLSTALGRTLICTPITEDRATLIALHRARKLSVLNTFAIPTSQIDPLRPIETNVVRFLFEKHSATDE